MHVCVDLFLVHQGWRKLLGDLFTPRDGRLSTHFCSIDGGIDTLPAQTCVEATEHFRPSIHGIAAEGAERPSSRCERKAPVPSAQVPAVHPRRSEGQHQRCSRGTRTSMLADGIGEFRGHAKADPGSIMPWFHDPAVPHFVLQHAAGPTRQRRAGQNQPHHFDVSFHAGISPSCTRMNA